RRHRVLQRRPRTRHPAGSDRRRAAAVRGLLDRTRLVCTPMILGARCEITRGDDRPSLSPQRVLGIVLVAAAAATLAGCRSEPPRWYYLTIESAHVDWTVTVDERIDGQTISRLLKKPAT